MDFTPSPGAANALAEELSSQLAPLSTLYCTDAAATTPETATSLLLVMLSDPTLESIDNPKVGAAGVPSNLNVNGTLFALTFAEASVCLTMTVWVPICEIVKLLFVPVDHVPPLFKLYCHVPSSKPKTFTTPLLVTKSVLFSPNTWLVSFSSIKNGVAAVASNLNANTSLV